MFGFEFLPQDRESDIATLRAMCNGAQDYLKQKVDFVLIPANPRKKASVNAILSAYMLSLHFKDMLFVPTLSGSGYVGEAGKMQLVSQLLALEYAGFGTLAVIGGDREGFSGVEMIALAREVLGEKPYIISGSGALIDSQSKERLRQKLESGANRIITQPLFSAQEAIKFLQEFEVIKKYARFKAEASIGVFGLFNTQNARRINEAQLGFHIPQSYIDDIGDSHIDDRFAQSSFERLWEEMEKVAKNFGASLYLSTPKHNDLRAYGLKAY